MYIDFIIISYLINYGLVYSALYIKRSKLNLLAHAESTFRCRASNTLVIRCKHNTGTEFEPLLETVVLLLQIADSQCDMP